MKNPPLSISDGSRSEDDCPSKFFKYKSMDERSARWVQSIICNHEIYFAPAISFNDPFDCRPAISLVAPKSVQKADYLRLQKKHDSGQNRAQRRADSKKLLTDWTRNPNNPHVRDEIQRQITNHMTTAVGVLCVSTKKDDILMWSHYADSHRGVCLEFDGSFAFMAHAHKVKYAKYRPQINPYKDDNGTQLEKSLLTKSEHWSYEDEWRLIAYQRGPGVVRFRPPNLTGIIIGAQAGAETIEKIRTWTKESASSIRVYQASVSKNTYTLDIR